MHIQRASCNIDFGGLDELLPILIRALTGSGGYGNKRFPENSTLPLYNDSSTIFSGYISTLQAGVRGEFVFMRTNKVERPYEESLISLI